MRRQLLFVLPALVGGVSMAWSINETHFLADLSAASVVWAVALLGPFTFTGIVAWRSRRGFIPGALAILPALLLAASPVACLADKLGEGCQYILALSPIYLWTVVAAAALLELGSRRRPLSEAP